MCAWSHEAKLCPWPASLKQNSCCLLLHLCCQCSLVQCSLTVHPGQQNVCCLCRMGTAAQRLEKLDKEAATLAAEGKDATDAWSGATDLQQAADLKEEYEYLKEKVKRLDSRLAKLEARLPVAGARTPLPACSMLSLLTSPASARGQSQAPRDEAAGDGCCVPARAAQIVLPFGWICVAATL